MKKIRGFEIAKGFENAGINIPVRKTKYSAGYDIEAVEDTIVPSFKKGMNPTLVKTGLKAYMQEDEYLKLCNRSSNPKKKGLILANSIGVVDADYYENPDNDGHIMFAFYNIKEEDITIKKGEAIGQAIFEKYLVADEDQAEGERMRRFWLNKSKIERKIYMTALEIRNKFLNYFRNHEHKIIPSSPLIPENDPSVLFTTAGMHPLVPYLLGEEHPEGRRLADYQKCLRTVDIDEVGDNRHLTYFEMLGNWSLGDYFKEEAIRYSMEFLTKELGIPLEKLSVTCFKGDEDAPRDEETAMLWEKNGMPKERIYYFGKDDNWWIAGETGPCGPDTEIFYDTGKEPCSSECNPSCGCGKYVEIWNNVFMQYYKDENGNYTKLKQKNVDTGLGLERINMLLQGKETPFDTEIFKPMMDKLQSLAKKDSIESRRIIAEHLRSSMMIIADGGKPSNIDRGYILRRLIRRLIRHLNKLEIDLNSLNDLINLNVEILGEMYPELVQNKETITKTILEEKDKFMKTLENGEKELLKELNKLKERGETKLSGEEVFRLYETYGFPQEVTKEISEENGFQIDLSNFDKLFKEHQEKSRQGSEQKFKGGLAEQNEQTIAYHTATHLLHKALQLVLGEHATQKGSNITTERLRFDFAHPQKVTKEELEEVEKIVNEQIQRDLKVTCEEMTYDEAKKSGAIGLFENKYGDRVKVYTIGDFSKEICGGPHVEHTAVLGTFKIKKEEASSAGVRRIKAILIK